MIINNVVKKFNHLRIHLINDTKVDNKIKEKFQPKRNKYM